MKKAIIGKKIGMTQIFDADGKVIPVTVIQAGPCVVVQKKSIDKEGYASVQLGFEDAVEKRMSKPEIGHLKKAEVALKKHLKEFRLEGEIALNVGDVLLADTFAEGECVDVTGTSKGKGTAGVIKRWGFKMSFTSHGAGPIHRHGGSIGANTSPGKVVRGRKMAGHMGVDQVTVQNLDVVKIDTENNILAVRGAVPGPKGGIVYIKNTVKNA